MLWVEPCVSANDRLGATGGARWDRRLPRVPRPMTCLYERVVFLSFYRKKKHIFQGDDGIERKKNACLFLFKKESLLGQLVWL